MTVMQVDLCLQDFVEEKFYFPLANYYYYTPSIYQPGYAGTRKVKPVWT